MKQTSNLFILIALTTFTLSSCGDDNDGFPTPPAVENTFTLCQDGQDNDGDGDIDCDDADCLPFSICDQTSTNPSCNDNAMNGNETGVDCGGPDCDACTEILRGSIGTRTLDPTIIYVVDGFAYVDDGDTLTIPAGTVIKAEDKDGADASALIVARGGKMIANGEPSNPIILTSVNDGIQPGETASVGLDVTDEGDKGQWGGLVILGKAPVSVNPSDATDGIGREGAIEGVPSDFPFSRYGGDIPTDDSGILNYVSIRFTGTALATNDEIQGLTLGGVGSSTSISNIEILSSDDDGVEFFGGTVDVSNILVYNQTDDGIDVDQNWAGTVNNGLVLLTNPSPGNDGFEIDGPEADGVNDTGLFTITNTSVIQLGGARAARVKSGAQGTITNSAFLNFATGQPFFDGGADAINLSNSEFNLSLAEAVDNSAGGITLTDNLFGVTNFTKGADLSAFDWSYAKSINLF